jgi:hypothetical protein
MFIRSSRTLTSPKHPRFIIQLTDRELLKSVTFSTVKNWTRVHSLEFSFVEFEFFPQFCMNTNNGFDLFVFLNTKHYIAPQNKVSS